jgi:hypothetical protein
VNTARDRMIDERLGQASNQRMKEDFHRIQAMISSQTAMGLVGIEFERLCPYLSPGPLIETMDLGAIVPSPDSTIHDPKLRRSQTRILPDGLDHLPKRSAYAIA